MTNKDLATVLAEYEEMPIVIHDVNGRKCAIQKIESRGDGDRKQLHVDLSPWQPTQWSDPAGWCNDATGV